MRHLTALAALVGVLAATSVQAQSYPSRPITIVVTAPAGGVTDVVARAFAQQMAEDWSQQVIVENKGGSAHVAGLSTVARAAADGHTLMVAEAGAFAINPLIFPKGRLPYDEKTDFAPITGLVRVNQGLLASKSLPVNNAAELIALAKQKPGALNYATAGIGSALHMNIELFKTMAGVNLTPVHYRGGTPALNDLIAGHVDVMSISVSLAVGPWQAGQIKILGIGSEKRLKRLPDVPTIAETGLPGYEAVTWFGLFAPAGTPRDVVMKVNAEARKVFSDPAFDEKFMAPQMFQSLIGTPEEFEAFIKADTQKWSKVVHEAKVHID
ncbi:Bug family tripartite tricarboxylate transporter substrate binding protein [Rhodoplanes sp. Z2-YC6860]|uniref:Bug family tripartite tricarboxylate transporter substrate binding protein n=1 Tax=Rhodoplanes sp. Z2-YC6860 TaxID=674703 RepID=UPI00078EDFD4|nr:tripartite tricarboxylate transporter substrate binding protein [Rhodoplanes sp. Z2-YC6860]AMN45417.1 tricarboxylate binding receptor [Rhodoplanes sp. Z2-YC6860]